MNAERRKKLSDISATVEQAKADIEAIRDEEQDVYDNMPESFQNGEKGEKAQAGIDALEEAVNACDEVLSGLETAQE